MEKTRSSIHKIMEFTNREGKSWCFTFLPNYVYQFYNIYSVVNLKVTSLNLQMRLSRKWGGAQLIPTAFTFLLLFMISRHSLKLSPDGAFSPSTELKQIQDGICTFSSSSNSTQACNKRPRKKKKIKKKIENLRNQDATIKYCDPI